MTGRYLPGASARFVSTYPRCHNHAVSETAAREDRGLFELVLGDGRPFLWVTAASLMFSGGFALFLSASREFLPHDVAYLGMTADQLCALERCRVVAFMIHDRVAFGGTLVGVGALYVWLVLFPLSAGRAWAWWTLAVSGLLGFGSFLTYLGYGYLDSWHGVGTLLLLPVFAVGLIRSRRLIEGPAGPGSLLRPGTGLHLRTREGAGRAVMLLASGAMALGGLTIMWVGISSVFVPQDLTFMRTTKEALDAVNPRLAPLIAHDRAGFGGGVTTTGLTALLCIWCSRPTKGLWQALAFSWVAVSATAIGIHLIVGYTDLFHLAPAVLGSAAFGVGLALTARSSLRPASEARADTDRPG
jgi:hypothetical protein